MKNETNMKKTSNNTDSIGVTEMQKKRTRKNSYPIVMRNRELKQVQIIYSNRVEIYGDVKQGFLCYTKEENTKEMGEKWTPELEVEIAKGSGFKRVSDSENEDHWSVWDAGKEETE